MDYQSRYSSKEFYWGLKPNNIVIDSIKFLNKNAKVLDMGCGEGRNSFFLARNKFDVTAVDSSEKGIEKLNEFAKKESLEIKTSVADICDFIKYGDQFDAIFGINVLQFINKQNIFDLINQIQSKTNPNGLNIISAFVAENQTQKEMTLSKDRYFFDEGELKKLYKDWEIIFYEEKLGNWETHGEPEHRHFTVKLIAKKKSV
jgi:tellurite methyltransferase